MRWTIPISRSVGTAMKTSQRAASIVTQTKIGRGRRISVAHNIREEQPSGHREDDVEGHEHRDAVAGRGEAIGEDGARRLDRPDQERHEEWKEKNRQQDFTGSGADRDRREYGRQRREADVAEQEDHDEAREHGPDV